MKRNRIIDTCILICLFIFLVAFPLNLFVKDDPSLLLRLQIVLRVIGILIVLISLLKSKTLINKHEKVDKGFLIALLPTFIICFTNLIYLKVENIELSVNVDRNFIDNTLFHLSTAVLEELVFRKLLYDNIDMDKPLKKIVLLSLIFALCHIVNFISTGDPYHLLEVAYTFGTGIIMGFMYAYAHSLAMCIIFHFMYNFFNSVIFSYANISSFGTSYIIVCTLITIVVGIYILIIYKKQDQIRSC